MTPPRSRVRRTGPQRDDAGVVVGWVLVEALVWTVIVEVALVLAEYGTGVTLRVPENLSVGRDLPVSDTAEDRDTRVRQDERSCCCCDDRLGRGCRAEPLLTNSSTRGMPAYSRRNSRRPAGLGPGRGVSAKVEVSHKVSSRTCAR
jgi:hypothetical protein